MTDICRTFRNEAGSVWNRMQKAFQLGIALSEETITECAIFNIAAAHQNDGIAVELATKPAESKHGADWEWWFVKGGRGVCLRVQAKRLYPSGAYEALFKSGPDKFIQLDKLVRSAYTSGACPIYCFYNFQIGSNAFDGRNGCVHDYRAPSFWGCAFAFAEDVKACGRKGLSHLRPHMLPWHRLVCDPRRDLSLGVANFINSRRKRHVLQVLDVPFRVSEMLRFGRLNRETPDREHLPPSFWLNEDASKDEQLAGIAVFDDLRSLP